MAGTSPLERLPDSNGNYTAWALDPFMNAPTDTLDAVDCSSSSSPDDADSLKEGTADDRFSVGFPVTGAQAIEADATNIVVTVHFRCKKMGMSAVKVTPFVRVDSTDYDGSTEVTTTTSYVTYSQAVAKSGGWTVSDINDASFEAGLIHSTSGLFTSNYCSQIYVVITWTGVEPPEKPTDLECERDSSTDPYPSNVSDVAIFSAENSGGESTHVKVQVCTNDDFADDSDDDYYLWDSGDVASVCDDGVRCTPVVYAGSTLSSSPYNGKYYWRIRFKNAEGDGTWSDVYEFTGINRSWQNDAYCCRKKMTFGTSHPELAKDTTVNFKFQTGTRQILNSEGCFNEAIQASGGQMVCRTGGKTHVVFLGKLDISTGKLSVYIQTKDNRTGEVGSVVKLADGVSYYDTHNFPVICADKDHHLYVFWSHHYSDQYFLRTAVENVTGSLDGEPSSGNWINPGGSGGSTPNKSALPMEFSGRHTYCVTWTVRWGENERIYVGSRGGIADYHWKYYYSDDSGETWSSAYYVVNDTSLNHYRVYIYGLRLDRKTNRLHVAFTLNWVPSTDIPQGVWYAYSDFDDQTSQGFKDFYDVGETKRGETSTSNSSTDPLDYDTDSDYRIVARDGTDGYFIEDLFLLADGNPYVLFEHKDPISAYAALTDIEGAKWNSGTTSWDIIQITAGDDAGDDEIPKLRVRRSGATGITDRDGNPHIFFPFSGRVDAIDPENFSAEMMELISDDDGDTFTIHILSRNSSVGVPIVNIKHELTDDIIELVWVSGNDIFLYQSGVSPYAKVQPDGNDLRIMHGSTQIHRIMDYTNLNESTIRFKLPETIPANKPNGADDLYLIYCNRGETVNPNADPDEVWDILFENYEEFAEDDVLEDESDWVDDSASGKEGVVYFSPPSHANKVFAGRASVYFTEAGGATFVFDALTTAGSGQSNLYILAGMWIEDSGLDTDYGYVEIKNNDTEAVFRVGGSLLPTGENTSRYYDGSWHNVTAKGFMPNNMHQIKIQVTDDGVSAWIDGHLVCEDNAVLTKAHQVSLWSDKEWFMDKVIVGQVVPDTTITLSDEELRGFFMDATLQGSGTFKCNMDATFGGYITRSASGLSFDRTASIGSNTRIQSEKLGSNNVSGVSQIGIANKNIIENRSQIGSRETGSVDSKIQVDISGQDAITNRSQVEKLGSNEIDNISQIDIACKKATTSRSQVEIQESNDVSNRSQISIANENVITNRLELENLESDNIDNRIQTSIVGGRTIKSRLPVEKLESNDIDGRSQLSVVGGKIITNKLQIESLESNSADSGIQLSVAKGETTTSKSQIERVQTSDIANRIQQDIVRARAYFTSAQLERLKTDITESRIQSEAVNSRSISNRSQLDNLKTGTTEGKVQVEAVNSRGISGRAQVEGLQTDETDSKIRIEAANISYVSSRAQIEGLKTDSTEGRVLTEIINSRDVSNKVQIENRETDSASVSIPNERSISASESSRSQIGVSKTESIKSRIQHEVINARVIKGRSQIESLQTDVNDSHIPIESSSTTNRSDTIPLDKRQTSRAATPINLDSLRETKSNVQLNQEMNQGETSSARQEMDSTEGFSDNSRYPVDKKGSIVSSIRINQEWQGRVTFESSAKIPIEYRGSVYHSMRLQHSNKNTLAVGGPIQLSYNGSILCDSHILIDTISRLAHSSRIYHEALEAFETSAIIAVGRSIEMVLSSQIPNDIRETLIRSLRIPVEMIGEEIMSASCQFPINWQAQFQSNGSILLGFGEEIITLARFGLGRDKKVETSSQIPSNIDTITSLIQHVTMESLSLLSTSVPYPMEYGVLSHSSIRTALESAATFEGDVQIPLLVSGTNVMSGGIRIPLLTRSKLAVQSHIPLESRSTLENVGGRVIVDWGSKTSSGFRIMQSIGMEVISSAHVISEWLDQIGATGTIQLDSVNNTTVSGLRINIEHGEKFITSSFIPLETLKALSFEGRISLLSIGYSVLLLTIANAQMLIPRISAVQMKVPQIEDVLMKIADVMEAEIIGADHDNN